MKYVAKSLKSGLVGLLVLPLLVAGCTDDDGPPAPPLDQVMQRTLLVQSTATRTRQVVDATGNGIAFAESDTSFVQKLGGRVNEVPLITKSSGTVQMLAKAVPPLRGLFGHPSKVANPTSQIVYQTVGEDSLQADLKELGADAEVLIRDRLLAEANVETSDGTSVTYLLKPDPTCLPLPSEGLAPVLDPECVDDLTKLQVRIVLTRDGDGGRLAVQIGAARAELIAIIVHSNMVAIDSNLAQTKQAIDIVNMTVGMDGASEFGLQVTSGKMRLSLTKLAEMKFQLAWSILEAVSLSSVDEMGAPEFSFSTAAQPAGPVFSLTGDGAAQTLELATNLGKTTVKTDWDPQDISPPNQDLSVLLGGVSWSFLLQDAIDELNITNFGWGDEQTSVSVRNIPITTVDLNPASGRRAAMRITLNQEEQPRVEVTPQLALALAFNFAAIAAEFPDDPPPAYLLGETYSFIMGGAMPTIFEFAPENQLTGFEGGVRMVAGNLTLGSSKGPTITVPAGQCLISKEAAVGEHELLGTLAAGPCQ